MTKSNFYLPIFLILPSFLLLSCSSLSNLPKEENVKVSRKPADKDCVFISKVEGRSISKKATAEDALKDLIKEAANKGANFLEVKEYSGTGSAVTGLAYKCP
jgi:hypothetical protein